MALSLVCIDTIEVSPIEIRGIAMIWPTPFPLKKKKNFFFTNGAARKVVYIS